MELTKDMVLKFHIIKWPGYRSSVTVDPRGMWVHRECKSGFIYIPTIILVTCYNFCLQSKNQQFRFAVNLNLQMVLKFLSLFSLIFVYLCFIAKCVLQYLNSSV